MDQNSVVTALALTGVVFTIAGFFVLLSLVVAESRKTERAIQAVGWYLVGLATVSFLTAIWWAAVAP